MADGNGAAARKLVVKQDDGEDIVYNIEGMDEEGQSLFAKLQWLNGEEEQLRINSAIRLEGIAIVRQNYLKRIEEIHTETNSS